LVDEVKIAGVQMDPKILAKKTNLLRATEMIQEAVENDAKLIVFPECTLTGYCYTSIEEADTFAEPINGTSIKKIIKLCEELAVHVIIGFLETDGTTIFNSLAFTGPDGLIGRYRKIHLPYLGVDRFLSPGDEPFKVYDTEVGKIGMNICYDSSFPESSRVLALKGAELIVLSTNWPKGVEYYPKYVVHTRAIENRVNYAAINRTGLEREIVFCGLSKIVDCSGETLAEANRSEEEIIYAQIDLAKARNKKSIKIPGEWETDRVRDRRPEFYTKISEPKKPIRSP
jgi:predicted amidohydrolase